ncbi:MAG: hypothetical protein ACI9VN_003489, partial [Patescibacteria group bacterium]
MESGYMLNGKTRISKKVNIQMRKIKIGLISYRIRPSFVLPYCRAKTGAHKTSNMMDRLMRAMNRHAFNSQMFHSSIASTSKNFRAFALL